MNTFFVVDIIDSAASKIEVGDRYDPNRLCRNILHNFDLMKYICSFEILVDAKEDGSVSMYLDEIPPGGQVSLNVTVIPKLYGIYESTRARIKYYSEASLEGEEPAEESLRNGFSTSLGRIKIISSVEHLRATSYYIKDWSIFLVLFSIAILLPLNLWYLTKLANEKLTKKKTI